MHNLELRVEAQRQAILNLTSDLIRIDSTNPPGNEVAICSSLYRTLNDLGISDLEITSETPSRPNLIARIRGRQPGPTLLLIGHTDTKPIGDTAHLWRTDPFHPTILGDRLYGLGSCDMKAAVAAMTFAAATLNESRDFDGELVLAFVADEEAGGRYGADHVAATYGIQADYAIIGEPAGIEEEWESLHLGCRGVCCFSIVVDGTQMHSSLSDRLPSINASTKAAALMVRMERSFQLQYAPHPLCPGGPTVNIGVRLSGGVNFGVYPGRAEFSCDIRTLPGMSKEGVAADLQQFLDSAMADDPDLHCSLQFRPAPADWIAPTECASDGPVIAALQNAAAMVLGRRLPLTLYPAGTDAPKFEYIAGIPTIPAFGPGLISMAHAANEWVGVEATIQAAKLYALAAHSILSNQTQSQEVPA